MNVACSIRVLRKAVQRSSSLIFSRSGTLVTTSSRVESESKDGRVGENGRENVRVLTGGNPRERAASAPRREGDLLHENEFTMPNQCERSATCWEGGLDESTQHTQQVPFLSTGLLAKEMETAEIPGKLDSYWPA